MNKQDQEFSQGYWKATIGLVRNMLLIWFTVSFLISIVFAPWLDKFKIAGYPLGFWFAQQGSIYVYIVLIFFYAYKIGEIDRDFDVHEE